MNPRRNLAVWRPAVLLVVVACGLGGCPPPAGQLEKDVEGYRQSRREAELTARVQTLEEKLKDERNKQAENQAANDRLLEALAGERNARRQEKLQHDLAITQNLDMKQELEESRRQQKTDNDAIKALRLDVVRLTELVNAREAELTRLREQVDTLKRENEDLRRRIPK